MKEEQNRRLKKIVRKISSNGHDRAQRELAFGWNERMSCSYETLLQVAPLLSGDRINDVRTRGRGKRERKGEAVESIAIKAAI